MMSHVQTALVRLLYLWALRRPIIGFVQGFNDVASVFYSLYLRERLGEAWENAEEVARLEPNVMLELEADTFWFVYPFFPQRFE